MIRKGEILNKPWGRYEVLHDEGGPLVKVISVEPGQALSLQSHEMRQEYWWVLRGIAEVEIDGAVSLLGSQDTIRIPRAAKHRLANKGREVLSVLEVQYGELISENDIVRYRDRYGRAAGSRADPGPALTPPVTVCEIGCNHKGDLQIAVDMIRIAAQFCKADVVKFQKRNNVELLTPKEYESAHPNPAQSYGETYGRHREFLEFGADQHRLLKDVCEEWGVAYSTSVWDLTSARDIGRLDPFAIKIPSAVNTNLQVLDYLCGNFGGEIHVSLGMTLRSEEEALVALGDRHGRLKDFVLYHCISGYPVDESELYLLEIPRLVADYGARVKAIGFSGHHKGIAADIAALTLGAEYFERHFTLDRTWKGTDHAASLEPDGFRRLARDLGDVSQALRRKDAEVAAIEIDQREKLKRFQSAESDV